MHPQLSAICGSGPSVTSAPIKLDEPCKFQILRKQSGRRGWKRVMDNIPTYDIALLEAKELASRRGIRHKITVQVIGMVEEIDP